MLGGKERGMAYVKSTLPLRRYLHAFRIDDLDLCWRQVNRPGSFGDHRPQEDGATKTERTAASYLPEIRERAVRHLAHAHGRPLTPGHSFPRRRSGTLAEREGCLPGSELCQRPLRCRMKEGSIYSIVSR